MFRTSNYRELVRLFFLFVLPSIGSQLLSGVYIIVDGYFVGRGVGASGLAAIGLAFPFTVFVTAIGAGIGVGGGALMSISVGRGRKFLAERILGSMVSVMLCASVLTAAIFTPLCGTLLSLYVVSDEVAAFAYTYAWILLLTSPAQLITMSMLGAVRNDGFPRKAMYIIVAGVVFNITFDWLLVIVYPFGITGAAWATAMSQMLTAALLFAHFVTGKSHTRLLMKNLRPSKVLCRKILSMGISPFGVQVAAALTLIMHNWQALAYGGDLGVAAYAVVAYIVPVGVMLQEGIAEGIQPMVSYYYGASLHARKRITARLGFTSAICVGLVCSLLVYLSDMAVPNFFSLEGEVARTAARGILLSAPLFPFLGIAKVCASYFQAVGKMGNASLLTYGDPFILLPAALWTLPIFFGLDGVWLAMPAANIALFALFIIMWRREARVKLPLANSFI